MQVATNEYLSDFGCCACSFLVFLTYNRVLYNLFFSLFSFVVALKAALYFIRYSLFTRVLPSGLSKKNGAKKFGHRFPKKKQTREKNNCQKILP